MEGDTNTPPTLSPEIQQPVEALRSQVERLKFDVVEIPDIPSFHSQTGADLRNDEPARLQHYCENLTLRAERDMQKILGVQDEAKFSKYTGMPLPEKVTDQGYVANRASLEARLKVFRSDCGYLIEGAKKTGVEAPKFDSQTGAPVPQDSLRAVLEVRKLQQREQESVERAEDAMDLQIGLEALREMKRIKREDEAARALQNQSPKGST